MTDEQEWPRLADRVAWENRWLSELSDDPLLDMSKRNQRRLAHDAWLEARRLEKAEERAAAKAAARAQWRALSAGGRGIAARVKIPRAERASGPF